MSKEKLDEKVSIKITLCDNINNVIVDRFLETILNCKRLNSNDPRSVMIVIEHRKNHGADLID